MHMARFVFSLQPLLDERRRKEEEKQLAFLRAKEARDENTREFARLAGELRVRERELHESAMTGATADLGLRDAYRGHLERAVRSYRARGAESAEAFDRAAAQLLTANRERRLVEKLKERRLREFEREEARREELELDDANAKRYHGMTKER